MAERKLFAGPRLRRIRNELGLTQSRMATELGVSPSYLNLIERDQRPLTVSMIVKLASVYGVDIGSLDGAADQAALDQLKAVFSDPLLEPELPSPSELHEVVSAAPNVARAILRLNGAYRETRDRLTEITHLLESDSGGSADTLPRLPQDEAASRVEAAGPWFEDLEQAAEALSERLKPRHDPAGALTALLREQCGVEVVILPVHVMPAERARFDRHSMRLFLSERVPLIERPFFLARQAALLLEAPLLDRLTAGIGATTPDLERSGRQILARHFADALLVPATRFAEAGADLGFDLERLSDRFATSVARVMIRWGTIAAGGRHGVPPVSVVSVDGAGAVLERVPGPGYPYPDSIPACGRLPVFDDVFPDRLAGALLEMNDGTLFIALATTQTGLPPADGGAPKRIRTMLSMPEDRAGTTVYAPLMESPPRKAGVSCRVCDQPACPHRIKLPLMHASAIYDHAVGLSPADLP